MNYNTNLRFFSFFIELGKENEVRPIFDISSKNISLLSHWNDIKFD